MTRKHNKSGKSKPKSGSGSASGKAVRRRTTAKPATTDSADTDAEIKIGGFKGVLSDFPDLQEAGFRDYCLEYRRLLDEEKRIAIAKDEASEIIKIMMEAADAKSVVGDGWTATRAAGVSSSLSKERLVAEGVTADIIKRCTVRAPYTYVQVKSAIKSDE